MSAYVRWNSTLSSRIDASLYESFLGDLCDIWFPIRLPKRPLRGVTLPDFSSSLAPVPGESEHSRLRPSYQPVAFSISLAAPTTSWESRWPGLSPRREMGPLTLTAALSLPSSPNTGALTLATPASLSATLSAQPLTRIPRNWAASGLPSTPPGAHASKTFPADPRESGMTAPTGTVSLRPVTRSTAATHTLCLPSRTKSCVLSPLSSRNPSSTGRARSTRPTPAALFPHPSSLKPSTYRPSRRDTRWCVSSADRSLCAVGRGNLVPSTTSDRDAGPSPERKSRTATALSNTPTPLLLLEETTSILSICRSLCLIF